MAPASRPIDAFKFDNDAGAIFWVVKPDQTETFELVWSVVRARLAASPRPELKTLASALKVFRLAMQPGDQEATYLFLADPASKTASYSAVSFLYELGLFERPEADEIYKMLQAAVVRGNPFPLAGIP